MKPILVTFLLAEDQPPFRKLAEAELPCAPEMGEPIAMNGRVYRVVERSWRFGTEPGDTILPPSSEAEPEFRLAVGILLQQIAGPPHIALVRGGAEHLQ